MVLSRICALLCLGCLLAGCGTTRPVVVVEKDEFMKMAHNMPKELQARDLLDKDGSVKLMVGNRTQAVAAGDLADVAKSWQADNPPDDSAMLIVADKDLSYQKVIDAMSTLQKAGVKRVALQVAGGSQ